MNFGREKNLIIASPDHAGRYMAFKHHISFATNLVANFDCENHEKDCKLLLTAICRWCAV